MTRKKFCTGQFLVCKLGKVSTFNFLKARTRHPRGNIFTDSYFCWRQQKFEIHTSQQQKIVWRRLTPLWTPLSRRIDLNTFNFNYKFIYADIFFICWHHQKFEIHISQQQKVVWRRLTPCEILWWRRIVLTLNEHLFVLT